MAKLTRKEFLSKSAVTLAGLSLMPSAVSKASSSVMPFRSLGKTGINVTPLCFGAPRTSNEALIKYAIDKGINFIDTGRSYANGNNEILVGKAVSGIREKVVIQTKIRLDPEELPNRGKGKKDAEETKRILNTRLEASLKALQTEYIDVLLYHDASEESLLFHPEVMKFFSDSKSSGVIKAHGFSAHNEVMHLHQRNNLEKFYDVIMIPFNHKGSFIHSVTGRHSDWDQQKLISILDEAHKNGIAVVAMKTCSAGKYAPSQSTEPSFAGAVKWVISQPFISSAAIAMATFDEVDDHLQAV